MLLLQERPRNNWVWVQSCLGIPLINTAGNGEEIDENLSQSLLMMGKVNNVKVVRDFTCGRKNFWEQRMNHMLTKNKYSTGMSFLIGFLHSRTLSLQSSQDWRYFTASYKWARVLAEAMFPRSRWWVAWAAGWLKSQTWTGHCVLLTGLCLESDT